jgi:hypothetical protein
MAHRPRHPDKDVEAAIQYALSRGWRVEKRKGHAWGRMFCPWADRNGCMISVYCTPKNAANHARQIRAGVDRCDHPGGDRETTDA